MYRRQIVIFINAQLIKVPALIYNSIFFQSLLHVKINAFVFPGVAACVQVVIDVTVLDLCEDFFRANLKWQAEVMEDFFLIGRQFELVEFSAFPIDTMHLDTVDSQCLPKIKSTSSPPKTMFIHGPIRKGSYWTSRDNSLNLIQQSSIQYIGGEFWNGEFFHFLWNMEFT